ncbi:hypothetical protein LMG23992_01725 [Cupriavidus laharis]|uniref:Uncharacterized protein n=1 Tax=Cupriavidus laharis TaxID=151654 RepID=A0ABM8WT92_9BURK|nr:hypothetical protein [Cupriavidus laharis]CAG9170683.1 hypothetical protein LMG23992_01725 [Cupriavidus laharis]
MSDNYSRRSGVWPRMQAASAVGDPATAPAALVLGVQWLNPLMWRDYPTQWNLLWAQGLAQPNADDTEAARFRLGDTVGLLLYGVDQTTTRAEIQRLQISHARALADLLDKPLRTFDTYALDPHYFYSVRDGTDRPDFMDTRVYAGIPQRWIGTPTYLNENDSELVKEQAEMGIPAPSVVAYDDVHAEQRMRDYWVTLHKNWKGVTVRGAPRTQEMIIGEQTLTINAARRLVFDRVASAASCDSLMLNPTGKLPSVTVAAGIETVGFYTLQDALAYLQANPSRLVWVWNLDAPDYPYGRRTNENTAILILGHPRADWGYAPLAAVYAPQQHEGGIHSNAANPGGAWNDLLKAVAAQAPQANPVERVYHDVHPKSAQVVAQTTALRQALHRQWPDLDQIGAVHSVSEPMSGPAGAASFAVNAAFAAAYANQSGKSAVVTSLANPDDAWAVLIAPPPGWQAQPPVTTWDRARGEGSAYWPWFGKRKG